MKHASKLLIVLVAALGAVGAGCGDDDTTTGSGSDSGEKQIKAYFLLPSLQDEARIREKEGAEAYAAKVGNVDLTIDAGTTLNGAPEEMVSKLENALIKQPDVVIINPGAVVDQLRPGLKRAIEDGVKVVTVDGDIPDLDGKSTYIALDEHQASATAGKYLSERFPDGGDIGIVSCVANHPVTVARTEGFKAGLASNLKVTALVDPKCDPEKSRSMTENMITRNPSLKGIWATTDIGALGAFAAVKASGKDIPVLGHDGYKEALKSIQNGGMAGTVRAPAYEYGQEAVKAAIAAVQGKTLPPEMLVKSNLITEENVSEYTR